MTSASNPYIGSALDDPLKEDGDLAEARSIALKRVFAWQINRAMAEENISKPEMARRMSTSRASLDRLLDPDNHSATLLTMDKAAAALGKRLKVNLVDAAV